LYMMNGDAAVKCAGHGRGVFGKTITSTHRERRDVPVPAKAWMRRPLGEERSREDGGSHAREQRKRTPEEGP
jgi:hypothetical protein